MQVLEHLNDPAIFAKKLFKTGSTVIISVPYKWKKGLEKGHAQDPVDENMVYSWTKMRPTYSVIVEEDARFVSPAYRKRWIGVYRAKVRKSRILKVLIKEKLDRIMFNVKRAARSIKNLLTTTS